MKNQLTQFAARSRVLLQRLVGRVLLPFTRVYLIRTRTKDGEFLEVIVAATNATQACKRCKLDRLTVEEVYPISHGGFIRLMPNT